MTIFYGGRDLDLIETTGALTRTQRRRSRIRRAVDLVAEIACGLFFSLLLGLWLIWGFLR